MTKSDTLLDKPKGIFQFPLIRATLVACILSLGGGCAGVKVKPTTKPPVHHPSGNSDDSEDLRKMPCEDLYEGERNGKGQGPCRFV